MAHALVARFFKHFVIKMQPRRGSGYGSGIPGVDCLISVDVRVIGSAAQIRRQRYFTVSVNEWHHVSRKTEGKQVAFTAEHFGLNVVCEQQSATRLRCLAGLYVR